MLAAVRLLARSPSSRWRTPEMIHGFLDRSQRIPRLSYFRRTLTFWRFRMKYVTVTEAALPRDLLRYWQGYASDRSADFSPHANETIGDNLPVVVTWRKFIRDGWAFQCRLVSFLKASFFRGGPTSYRYVLARGASDAAKSRSTTGWLIHRSAASSTYGRSA